MTRQIKTPAWLWAAVAITAAALPLHAAESADAPLFAAVGISTKRSAPQAAEQAARSMLAKFRARGRRPAVAVFLERTGARPAKEGKAIGDRVKARVNVPTFGTGGRIGTVGVTWWAKRDYEPTFQVLGLAGGNLQVRACLTAGALPKDEPALKARAQALGRQVRAPAGAGLALFLGGLPADRGGAYLAALREAVAPRTPLLGAVGKAGDYVYADGALPKDADGRPTGEGQLLLVLAGRFKVALAGVASRNVADPQAVLEEADAAARHATKQLEGHAVRLVLAFSSTGRLRTTGLDRPGKELTRLRAVLGQEAPVFGCFSPLQMGVDNRGRFSVGSGRLMLAALGEKVGEKE